MLEVQKFLQTGTVAELVSKYSIAVKQHPVYPNLHLFKYSQIDSPMGERIVQECRGLILDANDNWRVISRSFDKFFNDEEGHAAKIDWSTAKVQEKLDGSLMVLYWYDGRWHVQSSGSPDAGGQVNEFNFKFSELFTSTFNAHGWKVPEHRFVDFNFAFELMTPYNRVVVRHTDNKLRLIGIRNRFTGEQFHTDSDFAKQFGYATVGSFPLSTIEGIKSTFAKMDPLSQEGYVVVDANFNRVKVKNPAYVAIHHMKDGFGPKRVLEIVRSGEVSEFTNYFPEYAKIFNTISDTFNALVNELQTEYDAIKDIPVQKDFALKAVKTKCSGALFSLRAGKTASIKAYFAEMNINSLMDMMKIRDIQYEVG